MSDEVKVFVYCDNHKSRSPVTDFALSDAGWSEAGRDSGVRIAQGTESGLAVVLTGPGSARADLLRADRDMPTAYRLLDLRCRDRLPNGDRCGRSVVVRSDKLFCYLDRLAASGVSAVALSEIAANV